MKDLLLILISHLLVVFILYRMYSFAIEDTKGVHETHPNFKASSLRLEEINVWSKGFFITLAIAPLLGLIFNFISISAELTLRSFPEYFMLILILYILTPICLRPQRPDKFLSVTLYLLVIIIYGFYGYLIITDILFTNQMFGRPIFSVWMCLHAVYTILLIYYLRAAFGRLVLFLSA